MEWLVAVVALMLVVIVDRVRWWRFTRGGAFRCRVRALSGPPACWPRLGSRWTRRMWACWHDNELHVRRRRPWSRTVRLPARIRSEGVYGVPAGDPDRCGPSPLAIELVVRGGARVEVAAPDTARLALVGPYLTVATRNLPEAPVPDTGS
jgi:hypothetical protein